MGTLCPGSCTLAGEASESPVSPLPGSQVTRVGCRRRADEVSETGFGGSES